MPPRDGPSPRTPERRLAERVEAIRRFNRFYTQRIGVLSDRYLGESLSLSQSRLLYEIAHRRDATAGDLVRDLALDQGYVSRLVQGLERAGLVLRTRSAEDGRKSHLTLTDAGRAELATLDARANAEVAEMLSGVPPALQDRMVESMRAIESALAARAERPGAIVVREHAPGDLGWVVQRHGVLCPRAHGWDERHEAWVAEVVAKFGARRDARERCWIAESGGRRVGGALVVAGPRATARVELLLVEPEARRSGAGRGLLSECVRFARQAGHARIAISVEPGDEAAAALCAAAGFARRGRSRHDRSGASAPADVWELKL